MFSDSSWFVTLNTPAAPRAVNFGHQKLLPVAGIGDIVFNITVPPHSPVTIRLRDALYVPDAGPGLCILSVNALHQHGHGVSFDTPPGCVTWNCSPATVTQRCTWSDNVPYVHATPYACKAQSDASCFQISAPPTDLVAAHEHTRFCHSGAAALAELTKLGVFSRDVLNQFQQNPCSDCKLANATKDSYSTVDGLAKAPGDVLHADLLHFPELTLDGNKYALVCVDEFSRLVEVALLGKKSEAASHLIRIMRRFQTLLNHPVKYLRSDLGGEFHSTVLKVAKEHLGVTDQHVPARCHASNGMIERANRTLQEGVRAVLKTSHLPPGLWGEALLYVLHTYNLTPHRALVERGCDIPIPHVVFYGESQARLQRLHKQLLPFGIACYVHTMDEHPKKLADRAREGFIVGYGPSSHLYRVLLYDSATGILRFNIVRHVCVTTAQHREYHQRTVPPFSLKGRVKLRHVSTCHDPHASAVTWSDACVDHNVDSVVCTSAIYASPLPAAGVYVSMTAKESNAADKPVIDMRAEHSDGDESPSRDRDRDEFPGRHRRPVEFTTAKCDTPSSSDDTISCNSEANSNPAVGTILKDPFTQDLGVTPNTECYASNSIPQHRVASPSPTLKDALSGPDADEWLESIHDEHSSIVGEHVYDLTDLPEGCHVIGSKWVLRYKENALGEIERRKARLVAQGFSQKPGIDYTELFAPTGHQSTFRILLLYAARHNLTVRHVDIKCAFLQGELHEIIYMRQPPVINDGTNKVWRLRKPLYGLKQAPRQWNHKLVTELGKLGFVQAEHDPALFVNITLKAFIFVWVDDLAIIATHQTTETLVSSILLVFDGRDLGEASWILGLEILRDRNARTITMTQRRMVQNVLERFQMHGSVRPVSTPLDPSQAVDLHPHSRAIEKLQKELLSLSAQSPKHDTIAAKISALEKHGEPLPPDQKSKYMQIVGAVQYLATVSRPDIAYATGKLARFMSSPTPYLLTCALRLLRYLHSTANYGLVLDGSKDSDLLTGYADSNYVPNSYSTTGIVVCLYGQPVHWRSKRQLIISGSSTEAEIMAINKGALLLKWIKMLTMSDLDVPKGIPVLHGDNSSCITVCKEPKSSDRTRHIDGQHKQVQQMVKNNVLSVKWIPTTDMLADCLTKQLPGPTFCAARSALGVLQLEDKPSSK